MKLLRSIPATARRFALLCLAGMALTGCATCHDSTPEQWTAEDLIGHTLTLKDPMRVESYQFLEGGEVAATIGQKHDFSDLTFCWKIVHGHLQIIDHDLVYQDLTMVSQDGSHILAKRQNGHLLEYKLR